MLKYFFVTKLPNYPIVLGTPFFKAHGATIDFENNLFSFRPSILSDPMEPRVTIFWEEARSKTSPTAPLDIRLVTTASLKRLKKRHKLEVFAISMEDLEKAMNPPAKTEDPRPKLPTEYHEFADTVFSRKASDQLPPHRLGRDATIPLQEGKEPPNSRAYPMSQDQQKALYQYLKEYRDKGFLRPSSSPAASPILFVKKADGSLRVCADYRKLNDITIKNRYPLPLFRETLNNVCHAKCFTKLDIIAAFHKLRMAEGEEWKTAIKTRAGLFEYRVMPFGLCNAPSDFQAFINDILKGYLDDFCTAYADDILIYSNTEAEHRDHVRKILLRLQEHGIQVDIDKCEFHTPEVKYLGLIITKDGIKMDPAKIADVLAWKSPRTLKEVRSFLGFANFYRRFIFGFSALAKPLTNLTKRDIAFNWSTACEEAFNALKKAFTEAPVLRMFDPEDKVILETDASNTIVAGVLSQQDKYGVIKPVAFFSTKMLPAECNYEIYDKELLAIIRAFEEWRPELQGTEEPIKVITDHKNLEYFMTNKLLTPRQARWCQFLSQYNFKIQYRSGRQNTLADALTRRNGSSEEKLIHNWQTILKPSHLEGNSLTIAATQGRKKGPCAASAARGGHVNIRSRAATRAPIRGRGRGRPRNPPRDPSSSSSSSSSPSSSNSESDSDADSEGEPETPLVENPSRELSLPPSDLEQAEPPKEQAEEPLEDPEQAEPPMELPTIEVFDEKCRDLDDTEYQAVVEALRRKDQKLKGWPLSQLHLHQNKYVIYEKTRFLVPNGTDEDNSFRTEVLRLHHDPPLIGHPGRERTYELLQRNYWWPRMHLAVKRYCRNCRTCYRAKPSRFKLQGVLKPLPISQQKWKDLTMDFIVNLPETIDLWGQKGNNILVVCDRLTKEEHWEVMDKIDAPAVANVLIRLIIRHHGLPNSITSDRGRQFVAKFWREVCHRLGTTVKLSTSFHPQTDGQTERANQELEQYLRMFCTYLQHDWGRWLPIGEVARNNRFSDTIQMTPWFANKAEHPRLGIEPPNPIEGLAPAEARQAIAANALIDKMAEIQSHLTEQMAWAQAYQAQYADERRAHAPNYQVGDQVWLDTRNLSTRRPSKKLDNKYDGPFKILQKISSHAYKLELPRTWTCHDVFNVSMLRPAASDPLPGQKLPPPLPETDEDGNEMFEPEEVLDSRRRYNRIQYLVKWVGFEDPEWNDLEAMTDAPEQVNRYHNSNPGRVGQESWTMRNADPAADYDPEDDSDDHLSDLDMKSGLLQATATPPPPSRAPPPA